MIHPKKTLLTICLTLAHFLFLALSGTTASAQRISNETLNFPNQLGSSEYTTENAFSVGSVLTMTAPRGESNQLYFGQRNGRIRVRSDLAQAIDESDFFLDLSDRVTTNSENGLLGFAFHPNYANNRQFFVFYTTNESGRSTNRLSRFLRSESNPLQADPSSETILLDQFDQAGNHNGGDIQFGPDGYLYVSVGDEGGGNDTYQNGQRIDKDLFAGLLRLDVNKIPGSHEPTDHPAIPKHENGQAAFSIPADNPLVERWSAEGSNPGSSLRLEFYAIGLRNPWRFSFDSATGQLWLADVGQNNYEEVNIIEKGGNYGWPVREGSHDWLDSRTLALDFGDPIDPLYEYGRSNGQSITGGYVYRGAKLPELYGAYIFGDYGSGRVWSLRQNEVGPPQVTQITSVSNNFGYGVDPSNGDILISAASGAIRRLTRSESSPAPELPNTLSDTGAFSDLLDLTPQAGIYPYEPNVPFWSDHAVKTRWASIPGSEQIAYSQDEPWGFPQGSVWIKHFELEMTRGDPSSRKRVETRFLVKTERGVYGVSYQWNDEGSEANLVPENGAEIDYQINVGDELIDQTWHIPSRQECLSCHSDAAGHVLSFNTRQLNRDFSIGGEERNILAYFSEIGILDTEIENASSLPKFYRPTDETASLEQRARSYLAVNCVSCHQPNAAAPNTWDARPHLSIGETGLLNGVASFTNGDFNKRLVIRGEPDRSVLLDRVAARPGFTRMPPIGSNVLDETNIQLLTDWISLVAPQQITFSDWQTLYFGSVDEPDAQAEADPDKDGNSNRLEYLNRTLPLDSASNWNPRFGHSEQEVTIEFPMTPGRAFRIQTSENLSEWNEWQVDGNPPQADMIEPLEASVSGPIDSVEDERFFRVVVDEQESE